MQKDMDMSASIRSHYVEALSEYMFDGLMEEELAYLSFCEENE